MAPLTEPLAPATDATLRRVVLELRARERRRTFAPVLHVGRPGELVAHFDCAPGLRLDHGLRADVVAAMLSRFDGGSLCWLTRPGELTTHDADLAWLRACATAQGERRQATALVVVTPRGWYDPVSGLTRQWRRLRQR